ncbi:MAG: futalosine hydrolase [Bacteroidales bacterium]|nr:futalosine hydrolase [Bacteroidales bacterium]
MSHPKPILLVYASIAETFGIFDLSKHSIIHANLYKINDSIHVLISGIGIPETTFNLTQILSKFEYQFVLNIGLAGSFDSGLELGQIVVVQSDTFGDLGLSSENGFLTLADMKLQTEESNMPLENTLDWNSSIFEPIKNLTKVNSVTVNLLLTEDIQIQIRKEKFKTQIETMEGAAVFFVCKKMNLPAGQIRIISNQVGERNKSKWLLKPAIVKVNSLVNELFQISQD